MLEQLLPVIILAIIMKAIICIYFELNVHFTSKEFNEVVLIHIGKRRHN